MPTTARAIISAAFFDLGVIAEQTPLTAEQGADGLRRLNNMVSGWQAQSGTIPCIQRTIFPLVTNKQTYTIGLGGDFNVPRPVGDIPGAGLLLQGLTAAESVTSITRSGYTATVTQTAHPFAVGDEAFIQGANQIDYNGLQTVQTVPTSSTYTFTVNGLPTTPATGTLTAAAIDGQPVEIPRTVITLDGYQYTQIKNLPNSLGTNVYYVPSYPFGQVIIWPRPDTDINQLVLYLPSLFTGFADLTTQYDFPSISGYAEALQYQLNLRLSSPWGAPLSEDLKQMARDTFGVIKRANNRLVDLPSDAAALTYNLRSNYNIQTDQ